MDLLEVGSGAKRHPWERSRALAVERIARRYSNAQVGSILDWGCGDAFTGKFLLERLGAESLVGVDPNFGDGQREALASGDPRVELHRDEGALEGRRFDLVLLCDVIEHVADDAGLLTLVAGRFLAEHGRLIVTVPAFQSLFSAHDVALRHFRRYRLSELEAALRRSGLDILGSGYLFGSLLPLRALGKVLDARRASAHPKDMGVGGWRGGKLASRLLESAFVADNSLLLSLAERGFKAPGLSAWASCGRPGS